MKRPARSQFVRTAICILLIAGTTATAQRTSGPKPVRIVIDGEMADWRSVPVVHRSTVAASSAQVRLKSVRLTADERFVFVQVDLGSTLNVSAFNGTLALLFDTDGNSQTGQSVFGLSGADLGIELSRLGEGVNAHWIPSAPGGIYRGDPCGNGLVSSPTQAAQVFEFRLSRNIASPDGGLAPTFTGARANLKVILTEQPGKDVTFGSAKVREQTPVLSMALPRFQQAATLGIDARVPSDDPVARAPGTDFRVVVWNVSDLWGPGPGAQGDDRRDRFGRVFRMLDADVLMLDEIRRNLSSADFERWLQTIAPEGVGWKVLLGRSAERGLIAVRGDVFEVFGKLRYSATDEQMLTPRIGAWATPAEWKEYLEDGVGATGGVLGIAGRSLLSIPVDFTTGGDSPTSIYEAIRLAEARTVQAAAREVIARVHPEGILVGGDLNLWASRGPLDTLGRGLDKGGVDLIAASALQLNGRTNYTWGSVVGGARPCGSTPGRADWLLFSASSLTQRGGFVFNTSDLSPYWLKQHGLESDDVRKASDHLPIVVDFRWKR